MKIVSSAAMRYHSFSLCVFVPFWLWLSFVAFPFFSILLQFSCGLSFSPHSPCLDYHIRSLFHFIFPSLQFYFPKHPLSNSQFICFIYFLPYLWASGVSSSSSSSSEAAAALSVLAFVLSCAGNGCSAIQLMITWKVETFVKRSLYYRSAMLFFCTMTSRTHYYVCALCIVCAHSFHCQLLFIYLIANAFAPFLLSSSSFPIEINDF